VEYPTHFLLIIPVLQPELSWFLAVSASSVRSATSTSTAVSSRIYSKQFVLTSVHCLGGMSSSGRFFQSFLLFTTLSNQTVKPAVRVKSTSIFAGNGCFTFEALRS
jgi:hypothetical protein